jgi:hypothetical protein
MKSIFKLALALSSIVAPLTTASAMCFGTPGFETCNDSYGNSYTVNRMGPMTTMNGYNPYTGSNWSQTSQTLGNMTITNGITNGNPWNMNQQHFGGVSTYSGMNAAGAAFLLFMQSL